MSRGRSLQAGANRTVVVAALLAALAWSEPLAAGDWTGRVSVQGLGFASSPLDERQGRGHLSLALEPEFLHEWGGGSSRIVFKGFVRYDAQDGERTHADVRELYWQKGSGSWEVTAGIGKVFWGVTELRHLVDVVNQTDLVEGLDGEQKLGQPMARVSWTRSFGTLGVFVLPRFRARTFPGPEGRPRTSPRVDASDVRYESGAGAGHVDWAVRWSHTVGEWDVGLAHFSGTGREPVLRPAAPAPELVLTPFYPQIHQTSLDLQVTHGPILGKLEAISRQELGERFEALTGGIEHTLTGLGRSKVDLGFLAEYLYDGRPDRYAAPFQNDLFLGARLALNDPQSTEALAGAVIDLEYGGTLLRVEASRRLVSRWKLGVQGWAFAGISPLDPLHALRRDNFVQIELSRYF